MVSLELLGAALAILETGSCSEDIYQTKTKTVLHSDDG